MKLELFMLSSRKVYWIGLVSILLVFGACQIEEVSCNAECQEGWMDGGDIPDSCANPAYTQCLVSRRIASPGQSDLNRPVIIAAHGFGASTYEWEDFRNFIRDSVKDSSLNRPLISMVLLGGHGRAIDSFRSTTWEDWRRPIMEEYDSLIAKGYKNISLVGASTGSTLILQSIAEGAFSKKPSPKWFFFIDPIVIPSAKLLSLANIIGPVLGNSPNPGNETEKKHWYVNRPEENLRELYELTNRVKNHLEDGFKLPKGSRAKVYKIIHDGSADPLGALLIDKGLRTSAGGRILVDMLESRRHVFTRLNGRKGNTKADSTLQIKVFKEMLSFVK
jgi:carboxylesterase